MLIKYKLKGRVCSVRVKVKYSASVIAGLILAGANIRSVK